jgi:CheY-like chemotaxis protein
MGVITNWHFRKISAGKEWEGEINSHLNSAHIILLLISPNYLASKYCNDIEMKRAIERHDRGEARVIPVILSEVKNWEATPFAKFQALPENAKPIMKWRDREDAFKNIAEGIAQTVKELKNSRIRKNPKIIIIEDDPRWLKRMRTVLKAQNFEMEVYNKYNEELLHRLAKKDYDLLITDLILDSLAFTKEGKIVAEFARGLNKNTPIIVVSGYADVYDVRDAFFKLKIDDFVLKSTWDPANFLEAVRNALNKNKNRGSS